jgi:hypothetical protein
MHGDLEQVRRRAACLSPAPASASHLTDRTLPVAQPRTTTATRLAVGGVNLSISLSHLRPLGRNRGGARCGLGPAQRAARVGIGARARARRVGGHGRVPAAYSSCRSDDSQMGLMGARLPPATCTAHPYLGAQLAWHVTTRLTGDRLAGVRLRPPALPLPRHTHLLYPPLPTVWRYF